MFPKSSVKISMLRYVLVVAVLFSYGYFRGPVEYAELDEAVGITLMIALFSLKYLVFDLVTAVARRRVSRFQAWPWQLVGYFIAVVFDLWFVASATSGGTDEGFAIIGLVAVTPWILIITFGVMSFLTYRKRNN